MKFLSLMTYLGFVWALFVSLCLAPVESFGQTATRYSRVVAQAERIAYLAAQRSALASQVATAALAPSASSFAIRMVAGPVGWAALGVGAGLVMAQLYYSQADLSVWIGWRCLPELIWNNSNNRSRFGRTPSKSCRRFSISSPARP